MCHFWAILSNISWYLDICSVLANTEWPTLYGLSLLHVSAWQFLTSCLFHMTLSSHLIKSVWHLYLYNPVVRKLKPSRAKLSLMWNRASWKEIPGMAQEHSFAMRLWSWITHHSEGNRNSTAGGKWSDHNPWDAVVSQFLRISTLVNWWRVMSR